MAVTLPVLNESLGSMNDPIELSTRRIGTHMLKLARLELSMRDRREQFNTQQSELERAKAELVERERRLSLRETALSGREAELGARRTSLRRQADQIATTSRKVMAERDEWRSRLEELERCEALVHAFDVQFERIAANFQLDALRDDAARMQ